MSTNGDGPSRLRMLGSFLWAPVEERWAREAQARYERTQYQAAEVALQEVVRRVQPDDDELQDRMMGRGRDRDLDPATAEDLRVRALEASLRSPHMIGYLRSLSRFVLGKGPTIVPDVEDERLQGRMLEWWSRFKRVNRWDWLEGEIPFRTWRDGEVFNRRFVQQTDGPPENWEPDPELVAYLSDVPGFNLDDLVPREVPAGMTMLRLVPPEQIRDPRGKVKHGILTAAEDVCTVLGYCWTPKPDAQRITEIIPARDMHHIRIRVDQDVLRGRSIVEPLLRRDTQYEDWLNYRIVLNLVRSAVVLVKKVEGSASQLGSIRSAQAKQREDARNDRRQRMLKPGTTVHANQGVSYEYLSPNLQAQDAQHDGRSILLSMSAATGLPEYMFTGDASNANFASTMVAESPGVREFEDWQDFFDPEYAHIMRWVMAGGAEHQRIEGLSVEAAMELDVDVTYPPLMSRDELKQAQANEIRARNQVLSREGWAADDGIDWEVEKERLERQRREDVDFTGPPLP